MQPMYYIGLDVHKRKISSCDWPTLLAPSKVESTPASRRPARPEEALGNAWRTTSDYRNSYRPIVIFTENLISVAA
jgi:hypothetical protein